MDITLHNTLETLNKELLAEYNQNTKQLEKFAEIQSDLGLLYDKRPLSPILRPHLISRTQYNKISYAAETIANTMEKLAQVVLEDEKLLDRFDFTEMERRLVKINPGYKSMCVSSRFDTFIAGENFKFLEFNGETPSGVGDQEPIEKFLNHIPLTKKFLSQNNVWKPKPHQKILQALFTSYREFGGTKNKPNIAIVDWDGVSTATEFINLKDYFESMGFPTLIIDPSDIEYDGKKLNVGSFEIDIVYKRVLIHELLETCDETHPLVSSYIDGNLCIANSYRVKIPHKKMSFAFLTDEKYASIFSKEELEVFNNHIPWTRKVEETKTTFNGETVDLLSLLRNKRDRFLLKPNDDYGGKGIIVGWESSKSEWENAIDEALKDSFVVQEKVLVEKQTFPVFADKVYLEELLVDFDPFLFLNKVEGGMVRLSSSTLVNVTQGGGQTALVVLEDY